MPGLDTYSFSNYGLDGVVREVEAEYFKDFSVRRDVNSASTVYVPIFDLGSNKASIVMLDQGRVVSSADPSRNITTSLAITTTNSSGNEVVVRTLTNATVSANNGTGNTITSERYLIDFFIDIPNKTIRYAHSSSPTLNYTIFVENLNAVSFTNLNLTLVSTSVSYSNGGYSEFKASQLVFTKF